jgi:hypothetical protein
MVPLLKIIEEEVIEELQSTELSIYAAMIVRFFYLRD